jgi:hypothetical protein
MGIAFPLKRLFQLLCAVPESGGNLTLTNNQRKFCAWYNCDLFFFNAAKIAYLLFQQDLMYHRSQSLI